MASEIERHNWQDYGACITFPQDIFFPKDGIYDEAKKICGRCVVRETCLEYALEHKLKDGMWGGESPESLRKIRRRRRLERQRQQRDRQEEGEGHE